MRTGPIRRAGLERDYFSSFKWIVRFGLKSVVWTAAAAIYIDKNIVEIVETGTD
jgi:hypothetical protein